MTIWGLYTIRAETLCLGERVKGGLFRPCDTHAIRYSALTGALRAYWTREDIAGSGYFEEREGYNLVSYLTYAPRDDALEASLLPLTVQYLTNVYGLVVIRSEAPLPKAFELTMGALKSKGLGRCRFTFRGEADMTPVRGGIRTRIPCHHAADFAVTEVIAPIYGYLFEPTSLTRGEYVLSLWEGSEVLGPRCLVREEWT